MPELSIPTGIIVFVGVLLVLYLVFKVLKLSIKLFVKLLINALIGAVLLFVFNFVFASLLHMQVFYIPINWITTTVTGLLGVPGVLLLLLFKFII